jgi:hypothetical protein
MVKLELMSIGRRRSLSKTPVYGQLKVRFCGSAFSATCDVLAQQVFGQKIFIFTTLSPAAVDGTFRIEESWLSIQTAARRF